jgi:DNA ligase D-like protein (predicted 3'-phosphoesterase)
MSHSAYQRKRRFSETPEPEGATMTKVGDNLYLIHRHAASHLHWDLRLEMGGVLKSWAIPREPPTEAGTKRLAIQVEDHPIEYAEFSGTIPEGQYGAGTVEIWDKGTYVPLSTAEDKLVVNISGERLKGKYVLVKTKFGKGNNWIFFKMK